MSNRIQQPTQPEIETQQTLLDELAQNSQGWRAELAKPVHTPETEEYGVSSLVFRPACGYGSNQEANGADKAKAIAAKAELEVQQLKKAMSDLEATHQKRMARVQWEKTRATEKVASP